MSSLLRVHNLQVTLGQHTLLQGIDFSCERGEFVGVLGPNGAGKTTLLQAIAAELPYTGRCELHQNSVQTLPPSQKARQLVLLPQQMQAPDLLTVRQFVALGRLPYLKWHQQQDDYGTEVIQALQQFELTDLAERSCSLLSGGQWQRCQLARLAAQQAPLWLLDEPANHLDVRHQHQLLQLLKQQQVGVVASFHDLNLASWYCDKVLLIDQGQQIAFGPPDEVLTVELLETVYQCPVEILRDGRLQRPHIQFYPAGDFR